MELAPQELRAEWKAGRLRPVYYLFGSDIATKADALLELKRRFGADEFNRREFADMAVDAAAVVAEALTLPVCAERRLVILRNPKIPASARGILAEYLKTPSPTTTLVLVSDEPRPDKKDALSAAAGLAGAVAVFSPLSEADAAQRLGEEAATAGKRLAPGVAEALVSEAGSDWGVLAGELEKAVLFAGSSPEIGLDAVSASLGLRRSADPWAFERLIQGRELRSCLGYLSEAFAEGRPDETVFRSLAQARAGYLKQLKAKRLLNAGVPRREIETRLRIFYDAAFFARAERVNEQRLRRDLRRLLEVETDLKSKAWLDPKIELESLVVELCRPDDARS